MFFNSASRKFKHLEDETVMFYPFGLCFNGMFFHKNEAENFEKLYKRIFGLTDTVCAAIVIIFVLNIFLNYLPIIMRSYMIETLIFTVIATRSLDILLFFLAKKRCIESIPFSYEQAEKYILHEISLGLLISFFTFFLSFLFQFFR